jgi:monofunctional glycosyltransferase
MGFTRRYGNTIAARIPIVGRDGLDACIYAGTIAPVNKAPPPVTKKVRPLPGEEYETAKPPPPVDNTIQQISSTAAEPASGSEQTPPPQQNVALPPPATEPPSEPANGV